jgi:hypothetical protein
MSAERGMMSAECDGLRAVRARVAGLDSFLLLH